MYSGNLSQIALINMKLRENFGENVGDKFTKLSKTGYLWNVLQLIFCNFLAKNIKI